MDTMSVGELAAITGATPPTIRAAAKNVGDRTPGGHRRFGPGEVAEIIRRTGITPQVNGLTPSEVRVLAALARSPKGLRSARAVARRSGVSPTTAGKALRSLSRKGFATVVDERIAAGHVAVVQTWRLAITTAWMDIAGIVLRTRPPARPQQSVDPVGVPRRFWHLFWSGDPSLIVLPDDAVFVARRMIESLDMEAAAWAARSLPAEALREAAKARGWGPSHSCSRRERSSP